MRDEKLRVHVLSRLRDPLSLSEDRRREHGRKSNYLRCVDMPRLQNRGEQRQILSGMRFATLPHLPGMRIRKERRKILYRMRESALTLLK